MRPFQLPKLGFFVFLAIFSTGASRAQDTKEVEIYSSFDTPGYNEIDASGKKTGFEIELAEAIFSSQGYQVQWREKSWDALVADLNTFSGDKRYLYIASIEGRVERRANWLFASAVEFDASHYIFGAKELAAKTGTVVDALTGKRIPNFILDIPENRVRGNKLRIAAWEGSAFEIELKRVYGQAENIEILPMKNGDPLTWLADGTTDAVYAFASGPKNSYTAQGYRILGGPITNFDLDRFGGTSPALPFNSFGQEMNRVWLDGFASILRDDTFFRLSYCYFGRVSWPREWNKFLLSDEAKFLRRAADFEATAPKRLDCAR